MGSLNDLGAALLAFGAIAGPVLAWFGNQWWNARKDNREEGAEKRSDRADERESMQTIIDGFERLRSVESVALKAVREELREAVEQGRLSVIACNRCLAHLDDVLEAWDAMAAVINSSVEDIRASFHRNDGMVRGVRQSRDEERTGEQRQALANRRAAQRLIERDGA